MPYKYEFPCDVLSIIWMQDVAIWPKAFGSVDIDLMNPH